jgi:hypothetical protein
LLIIKIFLTKVIGMWPHINKLLRKLIVDFYPSVFEAFAFQSGSYLTKKASQMDLERR